MECYEGAKMIKTFRGLINSGEQDIVALHTNNGSMGYRVVKFQVMGETPATQEGESVLKLYKISQTSIDASIDFNDPTLLGVGLFFNAANNYYSMNTQVIFDSEIFNQDIYITHFDTSAKKCNYYLELEQVKLDLSESTVATLKDIRNIEQPT